MQSISKLRGPTGPSGFNGSQGDSGQQGPTGQKGEPGQVGSNGGPGSKGDPGINGTDGVAGQQGNTGPKGNKGEPGTPGQQGLQGPPGPQGPQGAGNFSQCMYKTKTALGTRGGEVVVDETQGAVSQLWLTCSVQLLLTSIRQRNVLFVDCGLQPFYHKKHFLRGDWEI